MSRPTFRRATLGAMFTVLAAFVAAGCGGGDSDDDSGNGDAPDTPVVSAEDAEASGDIVLCMGKDTSGIHTPVLAAFNEQNDGANATLVELPESADEQRTQLVQRLRAESEECDVLALDVIWTAEFAAQGWLADVGELIDEREDEFIESTLATGEYDDNYYAVPFNSNAGFVYYRTDQAEGGVPETWQELYTQAADGNGFVYQGSRYEGLTVHFLEMLYSAGGDVLNEDGTESTADTQENAAVLQFMVDGIGEGVPRATLTYKEEEARRAFENGSATFMRNWPYAYSLGQDAPAIRGKFEVAPFPAYDDGEAASVLGGYNLAISSYTDNEAGAAALIDYLTSSDVQVTYAKAATPPVLTAVYDDAEVQEALPFAEVLRDSIAQGRSRPVSPVYPQISQAISDNVYAALSGDVTAEAAMTAMDADIEEALETF
ncbi:MAG: transporter substrate-binding protein [Thermoleophilia bacterium]|jgi:multiple sugar transport system substrate-binding protein|nr:transporter substrate-binding protein [Thermoleophilia bacterium]